MVLHSPLGQGEPGSLEDFDADVWAYGSGAIAPFACLQVCASNTPSIEIPFALNMPPIISCPEDLEGFTRVEPRLLSNHYIYREWLLKTQRVYDSLIAANPSLEVRPYQPEYAALYCMRKHNICAGALGIGKIFMSALTICAIYSDLHRKGDGAPPSSRPGRIQIVAPTYLSASSRWLVDLEKFPMLKGRVEVIKTEAQALKSTATVWIYQQDFLARRSKNARRSRPSISRLLVGRGIRPALLVVDELHNFRHGTRRTDHLKYMMSRSKRVLGLSGTLSDGEPELLSHLAKLIYGEDWPYKAAEFKRLFVVRKSTQSHYEVGEVTLEQVSNTTPRYLSQLPVQVVPEYYELFRRYIHRSTLADPEVSAVCSVPTYEEHLVPVVMNPVQRALYADLVARNREDLENLKNFGGNSIRDAGAALSVLWPLIYAVNAPWHLTTGVPCSKVDALVQILQRAKREDKKVVIFTGINVVGHTLTAALRAAMGQEAVVRLYSSDPVESPRTLSHDAREDMISRLLYDDTVRYGVLNLNLCCESIDLTRIDEAVFWDIPWQPIKVFQAIRRLVRPGSTASHINIYYLASPNAIDGHQYNLLQQKLATLNKLMDIRFEDQVDLSLGSISPLTVIQRLLS